ncbi:MAG: PilZ domain-containing protein [Nitrospirota bacterium]
MAGIYSKKRTYERLPVHLQVNYFYNNESYTGTITNLSLNGMFIEADRPLPIKSKIDVLNPFKSYCVVHLPFMEMKLRIIVKVRRLVKKDSDFTCMGVEIVNPSQEYLEFVGSIRNYCHINIPDRGPELPKDKTT